ncbi:enolase [Chloropicon primus]|uniref:Enolase n=2 Tax=Chloropicon primus TaxID=1764295 RepID=A0A5B8MK21_9CHLO|nr:enolase [Chloropicon primus]UPR00015.1 enolase [Chloropicon primus]|eukprot:QDZ20803.1 enolase [Chloropicon primus]
MEEVEHWWRVSGGEGKGEHRVEVAFAPLAIRLNRRWKTAHSASSERTNAKFDISVDGFVGSSEVGLPPPKAGIYEGTAADCRTLALDFSRRVTFVLGERVAASGATAVSLEGLETGGRTPFGSGGNGGGGVDLARQPESGAEELLVMILGALDECAATGRHPRAALALLETAILRCLSSAAEVPVRDILGVEGSPDGARCFYTVGMTSCREELAGDVSYGRRNTDFLKFKVDGDLETCAKVFAYLEEESLLVDGRRNVAIDANCSWSPRLALEFLDRMEKYLPHLFMIEQPFPFDVPFSDSSPEEREGWARFKRECARRGISVYADESMRTSGDVKDLSPFCHGVNIKLEKTGGYREAVRAWRECQAGGLTVWLGCMVGTALNCNVIVEILSMSDGSVDLDGFLLTSPECQPCRPSFRLTGREECPAGRILMDRL